MNNPIIISGVITAIATIVAAVILSRIRKIKRSKTKILESTKFIINSVKELEKQLMASRWIPDVIVASGRGGAVVAGIAADLFGRRPLKVVDIHYVTRHGNREIIIDTSSLNEEHLKHKRILLVEFTRYSGDTANKIGTYMLALAAHDNEVPVYSVAPTSSVDLSLAEGNLIPIEERDPDEVLGIQFHGERVAPDGAKARNPAFDVTPNRLINAIVTENGIVRPPFDVNLPKFVIRKS